MIDIMIVDDNPVVRAALRGFLDGADEVRVVAEAGDGREALAQARQHHPTVVLLDYRMPVADGLSVIGALSADARVLVLTSDTSPEVIAGMLSDGASGYLTHGQFDPDELLRAILAVAAGQGWLSPLAASVATSRLRHHVSQERGRAEQRERERLARAGFRLTQREQEVLELVCEGLSNAAIAGRLVLSEKTVKRHLNEIFAKLQVANRTEATVRWRGAR